VDHGLLVAAQDVGQGVRFFELGLEQRLADASNISMPEDSKAAGEKSLFFAVGF
jgi:hypothetical protein